MTFDHTMELIGSAVKAGEHARVCALADEWLNAAQPRKVILAEEMGWPLYYKACALYELKDFEQLYALMNSNQASFIAALRNRNWGFLSSVMMEVCFKLKKTTEIPAWVEKCLRERIAHASPEDFRKAVDSSFMIAEKLENPQERAAIYRSCLKIADEFGLENLKKSALNLMSSVK